MQSVSYLDGHAVMRNMTLTLLCALALLLASATSVLAAETKKASDGDSPAAKADATPASEKPDEPAPADDRRPPGPPRDGDRRRPGSRRPEGGPGAPDWRQPGPPPGDDGPRRPPGDGPRPDGPPRRPGPPGPGQPPGRHPGGPRPEWGSMEQRDPEMFKLMTAENELDRRTRELARDYRVAPNNRRAELQEELEKLVTEHFEARQARRNLELKRFEEELNRLREGVQRREKDRQQIIERRVSELLGEETEPGF